MKISSWQEFFDEEMKKPYFNSLMKRVDHERTKKNIYPEKAEMFSCFDFCPFEKMKVVIVGQDPYHGAGQANGMSFSVKPGVKIPPSLRNIFKELQNDLGFCSPSHGNLEKWAEEGILLMNTSWSVEKGKPASHSTFGWREFSENLLEALNKTDRPIVFILWGAHAQNIGAIITNPIHYKIQSSHPSPFSANRDFFGSKPFSRTNEQLIKTGQKQINWQV